MPYTEIDHFIAKMRFRAAYPHLTAGSRVCDLGCGLEMAFLDFAEDKIERGVGVDDQVESGTNAGSGFMPTCGVVCHLMTGSSIT
jgi:hypothetical protein